MEREWRSRRADTEPAPRTARPPEPSLASAIGNQRMGRYLHALARAPDPPAPAPVTPAPAGGTEAGKAAPKEDLAKATIKQAVGSASAPNKGPDVEVVRKLLSAAGYDDPNLEVAIQRFQRVVVGLTPSKADGQVDPNRRHVQGPQAVLPARRQAAAERRLGVPREPRSRRGGQAPRSLREGEGQDRSDRQREDHHGDPGADGGQARRGAAARPGAADGRAGRAAQAGAREARRGTQAASTTAARA